MFCRIFPNGLSQWAERPGRRRHPLQDGDHSRNHPWLVPGFRCSCCRMFPERFQSVPEIVDSEKVHQNLTEHPESTLSLSLSY